jgi:hypothetical protein
MVHTYRNSRIWLWFFLVLPSGCLICAPFIAVGPLFLFPALTAETHGTPRWFAVLVGLFCMLFSTGAALWVYGAFGVCHEFRLLGDGWCEFSSLRCRRRCHASEINSVKLDEGTIELRYRGGKLRLLETDDFADFLARLNRLNPAVEVDGPERWATA